MVQPGPATNLHVDIRAGLNKRLQRGGSASRRSRLQGRDPVCCAQVQSRDVLLQQQLQSALIVASGDKVDSAAAVAICAAGVGAMSKQQLQQLGVSLPAAAKALVASGWVACGGGGGGKSHIASQSVTERHQGGAPWMQGSGT